MENSKHLIHSFNHTEHTEGNFKGLTKREYFAAMAMQGLLSNPSQIDTTNYDWIAKTALGYADEILKQLES